MTEQAQADPTFLKRFVRHGAFIYHPLRVVSRIQLTPRYVRITLAGTAVRDLYFQSPDDDVRVAIPLDLDAIPGDLQVSYEPEYSVSYPDDAPPYEIKAYTIRRYDANAAEIDLEIALHDKGHGDFWARNAKPGQTVLVAGAWGSFVYEGPMDHIVLIGDETALPAISHWIERLQSPTAATVVVEIQNEAEQIHFHPADGVDVTVHWVHRRDARPGRNPLLEQAVRAHVPLLNNCLYWGNGESSTMREIRRYLVDELGVHRKGIQLGGYWKREDDTANWFLDAEDL